MDFIKRAKEIHGNLYDYSLVEYKNSLIKVKIICKKHGEFLQEPSVHVNQKCGCNKCGIENQKETVRCKNQEKFIKKSKMKFNSKFSYENTHYISMKKEVKLTCSFHGEIEIKPQDHLRNKTGCPKCSLVPKITTDIFIKRCNNLSYDNIDYSKTIYYGDNKKSLFICKFHGEHYQKAGDHYKGQGCQPCRHKKARETRHEKYINTVDNEKLKKFKEYRYKVKLITEKYYNSHFSVINPYNLDRCEYHVDHIFSIKKGFDENIKPEIIGHYSNLRMLEKIENIRKGKKCDKSIYELYIDFIQASLKDHFHQ